MIEDRVYYIPCIEFEHAKEKYIIYVTQSPRGLKRFETLPLKDWMNAGDYVVDVLNEVDWNIRMFTDYKEANEMLNYMKEYTGYVYNSCYTGLAMITRDLIKHKWLLYCFETEIK